MSVFFTRRGKAAERVNYVGWIQSSGTQRINSEFKPTHQTRVVAKVSQIQNKAGMLFGTRNSVSEGQFNAFRESASYLRSDYFGTTVRTSLSDSTGETVIDKNRNVMTAFGLTITNTAVSSGQCNYPLLLFCLNHIGSASDYSSYRLHYCKIYENDVLVRDFWPCYDPDGVACLYDKVTKAYFYNQGTGEFAAGGGSTSNIEFTVDGTPYAAKDGMTWAQFVDSSYNVNKFYVNGKYVAVPLAAGGYVLVFDPTTNKALSTTDVIMAGKSYYTGA